jgi:protein ImuA
MELMSTLSDISHAPGIISGSAFQVSRPGFQLADMPTILDRRVHEAEGPTARAFALVLAGKVEHLTFWIATGDKARSLRARAVNAYLNPESLICIEVANRREGLWAAEEALRCRGAGLVVLQISTGPDLFESRRLQIAAQAGGTLGLIVIERRAQSSAAQTRWQCDSIPNKGADRSEDWHWSLSKNKQGQCGSWRVCGVPSARSTLPPDLIPNTRPSHTNERQPDYDLFQLTTLPRPLVSSASARPLEPA